MKKIFLLLVSTLLVFSQLLLGSISVYATSNVENAVVTPNDENESDTLNNESETVTSNNEDDHITPIENEDGNGTSSNKDETVTSNDEDGNVALGENETEFITRSMHGGVAITGYNGTSTDIVIPKEINGQPVIEIGKAAFCNKQLTNVVIPTSVTTIGLYAFCDNQLTDVKIPSSVTTIGLQAFMNNQLTSVEIPQSVTTIGSYAFADNQLTSLDIPSSVKVIEYGAFSRNQLASIEIPPSVTKIDGFAFYSNQLTSVEIPSSVTTIGTSAFSNNQLTSVKIPPKVTKIDDFAFSSNGLTSVEIPLSVTTIGLSAFSNNRLTNVEIPLSVTTIGVSAFSNNQLTSVKIPPSVTMIESYAFINNHLKDVEISSNVTTIGAFAFFENQITSVEIPSSVTTIEKYAFSNNQLTTIEIPSSVTKIESYAFSNNQLTSVKIPSSVTTIGAFAFFDNQLTSVKIPSSVTKIESFTFGENQLTSLDIPSSVKAIEYGAFFGNQLTSVEIPSSVKEIGTDAFNFNEFDYVTFHGTPKLNNSPFDRQFKRQERDKTFGSWFEDKDYTIKWTGSVLQPMTIYVKWNSSEGESVEVPKNYTVTFNSNGGSVVSSKEVEQGKLLQVPDNPVKGDFTFAGWYKDTGLTTAWDFAKDVVTENITLYAKWTKDNTTEGGSEEVTPIYHVIFNSNGGSKVPSKEVSKGELLQAPPTPVKKDHTFEGWYKDENFTSEWDFERDIVTANEILYAEWTKYNSSSGESGQGSQSYTVTFNTNGGSEIPSQTVAYKASLQAPSNPIKEGYTFAGWYKDQGLTKAWDFANDEVIENTTLYAKWTVLRSGCNITFNDISTNWAKEMIEEIANRCIIKGYPDGTFRPNDIIQRQHVVLMIDRALQLPPVRKAKSFTDVPKSHPYNEQITRLQRAGIVDGSNGAFRPNAYITRAQMAKILVLAFDLTPEGNSSFKDVDPSHWASGYIATLADHNIALGDENGNFRPNENLTRAQFTAFMYRALGL